MPIRRPSASAVHSTATYGSTASRAHRSTDSSHGFQTPVAVPHSNSQQVGPPGSSTTPQQQVVLNLVKRLSTKLPMNSGLPLDRLEADPLIQQTIDTLVELSKDSLDLIVWTLCELTDRLAKHMDNVSGHPTIEILQSQLFILKVLALTMSSRWRSDARPVSRASDHTSVGPDSPKTTNTRAPPSVRSTWSEPPPLDDSGAKYILSVMVLFLRQTTTFDVPLMLATSSTDLTFRDFELVDTMNVTMTPEIQEMIEAEAASAAAAAAAANGEPSLKSQRSTTSVMSGKGSIFSSMHFGPGARTYEKTHISLIKSPAAVSNLIARYAGRIVFHISAANWGVVLHRLRSKIRFLGSHPDDGPDAVDLQLMASSILDRQRLVNILNDLSSLLVNMGREAQLAVAISLRTAVWHWVDRFTHEFNETVRTRGRTEGAPERVFDLLYSMSIPGKEKVFWPCLTMLLCITYERISVDFQQSQYGLPKRKEQRFGQEIIRHIQSGNKLSDVALACAVDVCRVAALLQGQDDVPLRLVAVDLAHEIKGALWNGHSRKAFWDTSDEIDVALYADALVAIFRFLPEEDSVPIFAACMEAERSEAVKTCVVRACLTLNADITRVSCQKPLDKLQDAVAFRCRSVLITTAIGRPQLDQYGNVKRQAARPKGRRTLPEALNDKEVLLLSILSIWRNSPMFFMKGMDEEEMEAWIPVTAKLWDAPIDITVKISTASCLKKVTELSFLFPPVGKAGELTVYSLKRALPLALQCVAQNLLNTRTDLEAQRLWISLAHSIVDIYSKRIEMDHVKEIQLDDRRIPALTIAEIALMVALTSSGVEISHLAAKGLRHLSQVERNPEAPLSRLIGEDEFRKRNFIYEQLGDPRVIVVGRVGHQRRIRKFIRLLSFSSPIHTAVWAECYSRWRAISQPVYEALNDALNGNRIRSVFNGQQQELRFQWQNLTLFLATLCGACSSEKQDTNPLLKVIPAEWLPDNIRVVQHIPALTEAFIGDLINLLMHNDASIRDTAREALGTELGPKFYPKLIRFMDDHMRGVEQGAGPKLKEDYIMFIDQFMAVLKLLAENSHGPQDDVLSIDVSSLMLSIAEFINRYDEPASHRIKIKFCLLCKSICDRSEILTIRKDNQIRNTILDIVLEWLLPMNDKSNLNPEHNDLALSELNMACLRTIVKLLDRLQLRSTDVSNTDETLHVVSGLFKRYADRLLQCLDNYRFEVVTSDSTSDLGSIHQRMRISQKEAELRDLVITGLTHLVSSNSESGFKQCLHLAYDPDNRKRTIFAHVFARVIGEGTTFEPQERIVPVNRNARFADLLRGSDMVLAITICEICPPSEVEMIISVLLNVFDSRNSLMALMKLMVEREVAQTDSESALFRSNSTCIRLLSAFARTHGYHYLRSLINPLIRMLAAPSDSQEVRANGEGVEGLSIEYVVSRFITIITSSTDIVPIMIREMCAHIGKVVSELWPDARFSALGAFIFLRFISPAIVTPELIDVELPREADEMALRKGLMHVAKIVQSLANNIFVGKEIVTNQLNKFIQANGPRILEFLENLQEPRPPAPDHETWTGVTPDETDIIVLHRFFDKHADKIGKELLSLSKPSSEVDLGTPLEVPRPSQYYSSEHHEFLDLMAEMSGRSVNRVKELFMETEDVPGDTAYFVLKLSKIDVEDLDIRLLMYHIFKILTSEPYIERSFDIIIDCTAFSSISELPLQWLKFCAEVVPADIRLRFQTAHILNPNYLTQKYLRRLYNVSAGTPYCNDIKAYTSVQQMIDAGVPETVVPALEYPVSLDQENVETFTHITLKILHLRIGLELHVSATHLRFITTKASMISSGFSCHYVEVIPLSDVLDIYNIMTPDQTEFLLRRRQSNMYFLSTNRDEVVKAIRSAKGRLKEVHSNLTERFSRFSNIPATLLHIGFLSVDPNDEELRSAAYNLLGAVCTYLKYDKAPIVARQAGFIPGDPFTFVTSLSEKLSEFAPQLTLDFIHEVTAAMTSMEKSAVAQRISCLHYMSPWIKNLPAFANPTSPYFEKSGARLRDCIRTLSDLSLTYPETVTTLQKCVWSQMALLDSFVTDIILDELVRTAIDGGIGTRRCEVVSQIVATLSSISVRSRLYTKLRKALSRGPIKGVDTLTRHSNWNEIATSIRLISALGSSNKSPGPTQLFVPELCHLVTIVAAEGPSLVRKSVYGTVMNLLQGLYISRSDDLSGTELLQFIESCMTLNSLKLFGLTRETATSEYTSWDPTNDKEKLDHLEKLVELLLRMTDITSGSRGLLNIWRARWMSLVTATAFQLSTVVQTRSFVALGALATADVDDDFVYQIMVALRTCFTRATENNTITIVSMLRCLCRLVPALSPNSRYIPMFFWLAVALLQSAHAAFFSEAANLLRTSLEAMEELGYFRSHSVPTILLEHRGHLEDITIQLDDMLGISFETNFSLSMAHVIFKGMRHAFSKEAAEAALRSLLAVSARTHNQFNNRAFDGYSGILCADVLGYFLALFPAAATSTSYERLLKECLVDEAWHHEAGLPDEDSNDSSAPKISPNFLGINESNTALLVATFAATTVCTAQGDDAETEMLYSLLSELATGFPDVIALIYDSLREKIQDTFTNSSNANAIRYATNIFRVWSSLQIEGPRYDTKTRGSSVSTLERPDEKFSTSKDHLNALEELNMRGLAFNLVFLPSNQGHATKVINWITNLVQLIS
ncbi:hypothetical protein FA15DRAFT_406917 [Coprinopsis marcescibilis]|uniref:Ras-GAP domain-containing protein n=1 Tax=Coprinopsis marcescibilis TaxID=230819 RepID=A0A5C3KVP9_COPMA|nr:hypothetical protein FA15DRAFT_406917 [Coprinopsis marcescibilis]